MIAFRLLPLFLFVLDSLVRGQTIDDDIYLTNEENNLFVPIMPPIKITFYGTPAVLSPDGLKALVNAASDFATTRMRVYFNKNTNPTAYFFDKVIFEAIDVQTRVFGERKLRVFEVAEREMELEYAKENEEWASRISGPNGWNIELSRAQPYETDERELQQTLYGQSVTLVGNMTFSLLPSAPAQLSNDQLFFEMNRLWGLRSQLIATNHPDLVNLKNYGMGTEIGTMPPTPSPTRSPTESPTSSPTHFPSLSPTTDHPTVTLRPTVSTQPSLRPTISSAPSISRQTSNSSSVPNQYVTNVIIPVACAAAVIGLGFLLFVKKRGKKVKTKTLSEDNLDDADEEIGASLLGFGTPTKDDDVSEEESSLGSDIVNADASGGSPSKQPHTISTSQTMKVSNTGRNTESIEGAWTTLVSPSSIKGRNNATLPTKSDQSKLNFPVVLEGADNDDDEDGYEEQSDGNSITSETPLNTSTISATLATVAPQAQVPSPKSRNTESPINATLGRYTPTKRAIAPPNQVTKVTPSKVSKEEFDKQDWGVDIPFHWTPEKSKMKFLNGGKRTSKTTDPDIEISGSFPTFDESEEPPIPPPGSTGQHPESTVGDSSAFSNSLHPGDWSNNGGVTDEEDTTNDHDISATGPRFNMPPDAEPSLRTKNSQHTVESSPSSSKDSSKQLIHDLVWLEKKIADVRSRVDRLDGENRVASSPPLSPNSMDSNSAGSPISTNIICRDVVAPAGKLQIVIHSTKDGPAIHSVKPGSVLENKIFAGDLILAVNDHDTRNCTAEAVMEIMSKNSSSQRKLTVIHSSL
jgi:hypothetical protein